MKLYSYKDTTGYNNNMVSIGAVMNIKKYASYLR